MRALAARFEQSGAFDGELIANMLRLRQNEGQMVQVRHKIHKD